jgi:superfamily II DNA or RNA helicase
MPYADRNRDRIDCLFGWNEKDRLLLLPGARYRRDDHGRDIVSLPLSWGSCLSLRGMFGAELTLSQTLGEWAADHRANIVTPGLALRRAATYADMEQWAGYDPATTWNGSGLKEFQAVGVEWMSLVGSGILGDEMGSGKTVQSLTFIERQPDALPALVIVPNSVKRHWARLARRWAPSVTPYVVDGTAAARRKVLKAAQDDPKALVIINIESVRSFSRLAPYGSIRLKRCQECDPKSGDAIKASQCEVHEKELQRFAFQSVFLDEAHRIGTPESKQTRAVWQVMRGPFVNHRWGLSGTVMADHFGNLWSVLHGILPDDFPVKSKAVDRYCLTRDMPIGPPQIIGLNPATRDELYGILDPHFRRMLKSVTSPQLPPITREIREVELSAKAMKIYRDVESGLFGDLGDGNLIITHSNLTKADRCQQLAAATVEVDKSASADDISQWGIRMKDPSPKVDALMEILEDGRYLEGPGPGIVVACVHKDLVRLVSNRLTDLKVRHGLVTGDQSTAERDVALARFQDGEDRILIFTVKAGSVGLDMTAADTLVNLQRPWSMIEAVQTEGRVHRIGSEIHSNIRIIDVLTVGTIEEKQVTVLGEKLARLEEINRDTAAVPPQEQDPDLVLEAEFLLNADLFAGAGLIPMRMSGETSAEYASALAEHFNDGRTPEQQKEIERRMADPIGTALESLPPLPDAGPTPPLAIDLNLPVKRSAETLATAPELEGVRGLLEHVGIDTAGRDITVAGRVVDEAEQPDRMTCPCCGKDTKVNADGAIRYHFAHDPKCHKTADSRCCRAVGEQWTWRPDDDGQTAPAAPLPAEQPVAGYICRVPAGPTGCGRTVQLTANGRARSHLNPQDEKCGGGSDHPIKILEDGTRIDMKDGPEVTMCVRCGEPLPHAHEDTPAGPRPVEELELPTAYARPGEPGFPDETPEERERGDRARAAMAKAREASQARQEAEPTPAAVSLAEDMRTDEETKADQDALAAALKAEADGQITALAEQNGAWTPSGPWQGDTVLPEHCEHSDGFTHRIASGQMVCVHCGVWETRPRVLVTGSRAWGTDRDALGNLTPAAIYEWEQLREKIEYTFRAQSDAVLVSGACPTGADFLAEHVWSSLGGAVERHPAEWDEYGKQAGFRRNQEMVDLGADLCLAFIKNGSAGATHTVDAAARAGITCLVLKEDGSSYVFNDPTPVEQEEHEIDVRAREAVVVPSEPADVERSAPVLLGASSPAEEIAAIMSAFEGIQLPDEVVSATKINDWQQCKRKWWLKWYRDLEAPDDLTNVRNTGIRVHEALAAWYVPEGTRKQDPRDVLREAIKRDWNETLRHKKIVTGTEAFEALAKKWESTAVLERAMVEGYMEWITETGVDSGLRVVGSEIEIAVTIPDPATGMSVQARGVVDAKVERNIDGVREFIDHKTVGDFDRATKFLKMRNQMLHYHLINWLASEEGEKRCDGALYNMLRRVKRTAKAKPPFYMRKSVPHSELQLRAYRARLLGEARGMARARQMLDAGVPHHQAVPPSPTDDCSWKCEFAAVCPMFDDGSRAEDMLAVIYTPGDPWARYDRLGSPTTRDL